MKTLIRLLSVCGVLWTLHCPALMVIGGGHTNTPNGDCGKKSQAQWVIGSNACTIIAPTHVVTDEHDDRLIGAILIDSLGGSHTVVSNSILTPSGQLRILKVTPPFPTNLIATIYTNRSEVGKTGVVHGAGSPIGEPVIQRFSIEIAKLAHGPSNDQVQVTGLGKFKMLKSTNLTDWCEVSGAICTAPTTINLPHNGEAMMYYRALVTEPLVITNGYRPAPADYILRNGLVIIGGIGPNGLISTNFHPSLGTNGCAIWSDDSSGGMFIQENGIWKFAGVVHGSSTIEPWSIGGGDPFYAAMKDLSGITYFNSGYTLPLEGGPYPTESYFTRVSDDAKWIIKNFAGK